MSSGDVLQSLISGVSAGAMYGLLAVGFSLVFRTTRIVNFAQGDLAAVAAYLAFTLHIDHHVPMVLTLLIVVVAVGTLSATVQQVVLRPLYRHGVVYPIIATVGLSLALQGAIQVIWGPIGKQFPHFLGGDRTDVLGVHVVPEQLAVFAIGLVLAGACLAALKWTKYGLAMRSAAIDQGASELLGIDARKMFLIAFFAAGALAALAGVLVAPLAYLQPTMGLPLGLAAFVAAVIGGMGSPGGAFLGGVLVGAIQNVAVVYVDPNYSQVIVYGLLVVVLLLRPSGLLGEEGTRSRAV